MSALAAGRPQFHRDPLFWLAVAAGGGVAAAIGLWIPLAGPQADSAVAWLVISTIVIYPVLEELAFRGVLQGWLLSYDWGRSARLGITAANLITTGVFVVLHFLHHSPAWAASVMVPSLVFGFFRDRHRSVYPAIALHVLYNLFYLLAVTLL
jgi:membrane protease YdiL (CAAX protease family)